MSRVLFLVSALFAASAHAETRFFSALEDVPLAPGLQETGSGFWFEDANGRIVVGAAEGSVSPEALRAFYLATLPELGWAQSPGDGAVGDLVFQRGRERLTLTIAATADGGQLQARLFVRPAQTRSD